jgi:hypothetical protein
LLLLLLLLLLAVCRLGCRCWLLAVRWLRSCLLTPLL